MTASFYRHALSNLLGDKIRGIEAVLVEVDP
jgi:hypothetical protein